MTKQEYLKKLSNMYGIDLIMDELPYRRGLVREEINANGRDTQKYYELLEMYYTCRDYIIDRLDKGKQLPLH